MVTKYLKDGWTQYYENGTYNFERVVTLAGVTQTETLNLPPCRIDRITQWFNTTNSRAFNIRVFSSDLNKSAYEELDKKSGHSTQSRQFVPINPDSNRYLTPIKIQFNYSSYTAGDQITILIQVSAISSSSSSRSSVCVSGGN